jgi:hypothetical protein
VEKWRHFRAELARLMNEGEVTVAQVVRATPIGRETLYGYLRDREAGVGNGDWETVGALLRCIESLAGANGHVLGIDHAGWQRSWQKLRDRQDTARRPSREFAPRLSADTWIGGRDGAPSTASGRSSRCSRISSGTPAGPWARTTPRPCASA